MPPHVNDVTSSRASDKCFHRKTLSCLVSHRRWVQDALPFWDILPRKTKKRAAIKKLPNTMSSIQLPPFRVLVIGGGLAGLTAAHALRKANIDHVVLERGKNAAPATGASIAIYPHGARILQQIGCLQAAKNACTPMKSFVNRMPDGKSIVDSRFFDYVVEK